MRESMLEILRCPACGTDRRLALDGAAQRDEREIREATLRCGACSATFPVREGIVELLHDPPDHVTREAAGLERFAGVMRNDGWGREKIRSLPYVEDGYWYVQAVSFERIMAQTPFQAGQRLLDVGSNTCWASARLAGRGLDVVALDIALAEMQGLRTAEYFIGEEGRYFERLLSTMAAPAIASESMDWVFCTEVLHHNDRRALFGTLRELYRVLRPGGQVLVANEPLRFLFKPKLDHARDVEEFEGHEHVYFMPEYVLAARRAGFSLSLHAPPYDTFSDRARWVLRHVPHSRRPLLAWKALVVGDMNLHMTCTKPAH
ncbi:MAG TPA: methyltransferase domain-containing protein [Solirubrobacteraceae bacterium]|jgi:SAM-dependent methyltransferase|nr:methyltransferase domain-containing protein [Solirubrobacteraceae bacterium]